MNKLTGIFCLFPLFCLAWLFELDSIRITEHLIGGDIGSIAADVYYETDTPFGDEVVWAWDLISKPTNAITGAWGEMTGLFVPMPYENYGVGRESILPTTYIQIFGQELGMCLNVQDTEVPHQTYNPNVKYFYKWNRDYYTGHKGAKIWLYPYHTAYSNSNPVLQCSFQAAVKTSYGTGVRHANTSFQWRDEESDSIIYVQHYVYDSRDTIKTVSSGYDKKISQLWVALMLGSPDAYCGTLPGSAVFTNSVWADYNWFGITQSWDQFLNMVLFLNTKHGINLGTDRDKWRLVSVSFNLEMQQKYEGCMAGKFKQMKVWTSH